jgi:hypothetical protein
MIKFRNRKTGKVIECNEKADRHLIIDLQKNKDYQELFII